MLSEAKLTQLAKIIAEKFDLETKVPNRVRHQINEELRAVGFDGNRRFESIGQALNVADGVLQQHGLEWGEVTSADLFREPSGFRTILLARTNREDLFSPNQSRAPSRENPGRSP